MYKKLTIIERGEPYIMIENIAAAKPQNTFLELPCRAKSEMKTTAANIVITKANKPLIFSFSFFGAYRMKMKTYMISITAPVPLIIVTSMLCGDTNGKPYLKIVKFILISELNKNIT